LNNLRRIKKKYTSGPFYYTNAPKPATNPVMNRKINHELKEVLIHISIWVLYFLYENGAVWLIYPDSVFLLSSGLYFLLNALVFYGNFQFIKYIGNKRFKYELRLLTIIGLGLFYLAANYYLMKLIHSIHLPTTMYTSSVKQFVILRIFRYLYIMSVSYTYWLITDKLRVERNLTETQKKRLIEQEKSAELEKEKINTELNYLRLQINPHFLFNTLSFIYTEVIKYSEKASNGVMLLSQILRNILAEPDPQGKIALKEEIGHMVNLIELHQLRFNQKLAIDLNVNALDQSSDKKIIPFILITSLENAFKHGDLLDKKNPTIINLIVVNDYLYFSLRNKKKTNQSKTQSLGIGIKNIEKRLNLAYPDNHTLKIKNENNFYSFKLKIPISHDKLRNN